MQLRSIYLVSSCFLLVLTFQRIALGQSYDAGASVRGIISKQQVGKSDWPQMFGSHIRNNVTDQENIPVEWDVLSGVNVRWSMDLGSETYGSPTIANGKVYVGTNNGAGYVKRYPAKVDLGALICFAEKDGKFLWQHCNEKLPGGAAVDWPHQGICCSPLVDGNRVWYVSSRGEVVCLDAEGFHDNENDGRQDEPNENQDEADVIWSLDMMSELGTIQHNMCSCSVTSAGNLLFVNTSNGVDEGHKELPAPDAPSFLCLERNTGEVLWADNTPGGNVLHGQWSSPAYTEVDGVGQVLFGGGDGWLYSFSPEGKGGKSQLLWKFDCNPKASYYRDGGTGDRNFLVGTPVVYDGLVYIAVGEDPEYGESQGHLWCIDPTRRGDVSPTLVFNDKGGNQPIPHKRRQALDTEQGDSERENPNSALIWHYVGADLEEFETTMHRTIGSVAIKNDLLFIADFSGVFHCIDAKTGNAYWTYDMFASSWASPLIVQDRVYISDQDGNIRIFQLAKAKTVIAELYMENTVYTSPAAANNTLFVASRQQLFAIAEGEQLDAEATER